MSFFMAREVQRSNYDGKVIPKHERWNRYIPFEFNAGLEGDTWPSTGGRQRAAGEFYQSCGLSPTTIEARSKRE
jgi:hypothetical protein